MKKIIFVLTLLFVCIIITGCNLPKPEPNYSSTDKNYLLLSKSEEKYSIQGQEQIQSYNNFISSLISFSADLSEKVYLKYGNKYDRMVISPISLYMALAMATSVASEDAKEELEQLIGIPYEEMCEYSKYLMSTINKSFYQYGSLSSMVNLSNSISFSFIIVIISCISFEVGDVPSSFSITMPSLSYARTPKSAASL